MSTLRPILTQRSPQGRLPTTQQPSRHTQSSYIISSSLESVLYTTAESLWSRCC